MEKPDPETTAEKIANMSICGVVAGMMWMPVGLYFAVMGREIPSWSLQWAFWGTVFAVSGVVVLVAAALKGFVDD